MSLSNKELLDKCKEMIAKKYCYQSWDHYMANEWDSDSKERSLYDQVCELYATEKAKELQAFKELFEAFFADFQERYAFQVPYNGTSEFYNQKKIEQSEAFKIDMKFAWDKIVLKKEF